MYTIGCIFITLIFIGFFSGYEIAFVSASRLSIELKKKQGKWSGIILSRFVEQPAKFIGSCLVGLNIFLVVYGLLITDLMKKVLWDNLGVEHDSVKLIVDTIVSTFIVLIIGEFFPKAIFRAKNDALLNFFAPVANFFYNLLRPITSLFVDMAQWILKYLFNINVKNTSEAFTYSDLEHYFQQNKEQDEENTELNTELVENALSLPTIKIRQCLVPRTEVEAVDINTPISQVKQHFISTKLSRLVVYDGTIDDIQGYVHQLDLFKHPASIKDILLPISIVPESMAAADLINKFRKESKSVAWVVDEFGGTAGIITMEDVLEEIFGEIKDEYDIEEFEEKQLTDNEFLFSGRLELDYLNEKFNLKFPESESETLSGYIIQENEDIPQPKESIIINNYQFEILNVSDRRIEMVKMKILR
jgi:CBS domain containing-hemolysin-like protein